MYKVPYCEDGKRISWLGKEYILEKREYGHNIIFPIILRLLGRISSGEEGKVTEILGKIIKIKKMGVGKNIMF